MTILTDRFLPLGDGERAALGMADLPLAVIPHPVAGMGRERVRANVDAAQALDQVLRGLVKGLAAPA